MNGITLLELNGWLQSQLDGWLSWAEEAGDRSWLALPTGNERFPTVGTLFRHAFTPLHRYSDQAASAEPVDDSAIDPADWAQLSAWAATCLARHHSVCSGLDATQADHPLSFATRSAGTLTVPRRIALTHATTHCFWHLGGIAHLLRANGIAPPQRSDLIFYASKA